MRIAYIILTCEAYEKTRRVWQRETALRTVPWEDMYYLGGKEMREAERIFSWGAPDDYPSLPWKFVDFFTRTELGEQYDWFFLLDDDTYVYEGALRRRVAHLQKEEVVPPQEVVYAEGCLLTHLVGTPWGIYPSGGAGTLLSSAAYRGIQDRLRNMLQQESYQPPHHCADICLGLWLKSIPGHRMVHYDGFHDEPAQIGQGGTEEDITFHHVATHEDFWAHWRIGQRKLTV